MHGDRTRRDPHALTGLGPARRVMYRFAQTPAVGTGAAAGPTARQPPEVAGARRATIPVPARGAVAANDLAVLAAIARFELQAGMGSADFALRYRSGEFGHAAWARVWFGLLQ